MKSKKILKRKNFKNVLLAFLILGFSGCSLFGKESLPYLVEARMNIEDSENYQIAGLDFSFFNKEEKKLKSFTLVFFMYDEDGNPVSFGKSNMVLTVEMEIEAGAFDEGCICLDKFLYEIPEVPYEIDYLYVSRIVYEDDSVWSDPFGLLAF